MYERRYNEWLDSINQATHIGQMQHNDAWKNKEYTQNEDHFTKNMEFEDKWNQKNMEFEDKWNQKNMDFQASENAKNRAVKSSSGGAGNGYDYSAEDMQKASNSQAVKSFKASILTEDEFIRRGKSAKVKGNSARFDNYNQYVDAKLDEYSGSGKLTENEVAYLVGYYFR